MVNLKIGDVVTHPDGFKMTLSEYNDIDMKCTWFDNNTIMIDNFKKDDIFPDYLLIKDLPGYKKGCIFSMGSNYIYYISHDPEKVGWMKISDSEKFEPCENSLLRFNIDQMSSNKEWFLKIDKQVRRDLKIEEIWQEE